VHHVNPTCGDEVTLRVHVEDGIVSDVSYDALGCSISQASTSVMTDLVIGRPVAEGMVKQQEFLALMQGKGRIEPDEEVLEDGIAFAGVAKFPARIKCALLGWMAWKDAVAQVGASQTQDRGCGRGGRMSDQVTDISPTSSDPQVSGPDDDLPEVDLSGGSSTSREDVLEALKDVVDPELGINVVDLGLIYDVQVDEETNAVIDMTLTSAACPLTDVIEDQTAQALEGLVNDHRINWVWMPPWGPDKITDDGREMLRALGFNV